MIDVIADIVVKINYLKKVDKLREFVVNEIISDSKELLMLPGITDIDVIEVRCVTIFKKTNWSKPPKSLKHNFLYRHYSKEVKDLLERNLRKDRIFELLGNDVLILKYETQEKLAVWAYEYITRELYEIVRWANEQKFN